MGFTAGIYAFKKFNKDITYNDIRVIEDLLNYERNAWIKENYESAEAYAKAECKDNEREYKLQSEEAISFYRDILNNNHDDHPIIGTEYAMWCSNGSGDIYEYAKSLGEEIQNRWSGNRTWTKQDVYKFMQFCLDKVKESMPEQCEITGTYKYIRDNDGDIPERPKIMIEPCDGIEVRFTEDDAIKRIDTNPEWGLEFGLPRNYFDAWEFDGYMIGIEACAKMLSEVDFENSIIVYEGGW